MSDTLPSEDDAGTTGAAEQTADQLAHGLGIELEADPTINFAMQQNDVPAVKALRITNGGEAPVGPLAIAIRAEPAFARPWTGVIDAIAPGATFNLSPIDLELSAQFLLDLTERLTGTIHVEIRPQAAASAEPASQSAPPLAAHARRIDVLARDEWSGLRSLPEILAAFVVPNHPAVDQLMASAAAILEKWTGDASLSGYQSQSRDRVLKMAGAIFAALHQLGLSYINPPASFEQSGQKIRLPDRLLANKMGTCLDLAVLMAGCLEAAGLHPLVVLVEGHAFAGVWLTDDSYADCAEDDAASVRKRADLGEIAVFETTLLTAPDASFERAQAEARARLRDEPAFQCALDIHRARKSRIRPLPLKSEGGEVQITLGERPARRNLAGAAPTLASKAERIRVDGDGPPADETPATRLDRWKRKLLDLTLNNRLLNFKDSKKTTKILCPSLGGIEDALADGQKFVIAPKPTDLETGPRDNEIYRQRTGEDLLQALLEEEFKSRRLRADLPQNELAARLVEIYRTTRSSIEESGSNPLYLALGFLRWFESPASQQERLAPILLIPLELERKMVREGFRIRKGDDEPMVNITLLEMLKRDHGIVISGLDPVPQDEHGVDVQLVLDTVRTAILNLPRWDIVEEARIGLFTFAKHLMWRDLEVRSADLAKNHVVDHLINRPHEPFPTAGDFPDPDRLDAIRPLAETYCPMDADSSQLAAVYAAAEGRSFVLEGPPGTGKSQTITNMIAQALAMGKSVLFVSEKIAALGVVHSRLKKIGLGRFCLELHSSKSHKKEVIQQLGAALERVQQQEPASWSHEVARLEELRRKLNAYPEAIHKPRAIGESFFQALSRLIGLRAEPTVRLAWPSPDAIDALKLEEMRECIARLATASDGCGHPTRHVWAAAGCEEWSMGLQREVEAALDECDRLHADLEIALGEAAKPLGMHGDGLSLKALAILVDLADLLLRSPGAPAAILTEPDWPETEHALGEWIRHGRRRDELRVQVFAAYQKSILALDLDGLAAQLARAEAAWGPLRWFKRRPVAGQLRRAANPGAKPDTTRLAADLEAAIALRAEEKTLAQASDRARVLLGRFWGDGDPEWDAVARIGEWTAAFRKLAGTVGAGNLERAAQFRERFARLLAEGGAEFTATGSIGRKLAALQVASRACDDARAGLESRLALDPAAAWGPQAEPKAISRIRERLHQWKQNLPALRPWCHWNAVRRQAADLQLAPVVDRYVADALPSDRLRPLFDKAFYSWWVEAQQPADPILKNFFSADHEHLIRKFRELDTQFLQLSAELVQARLAAKVPVSGDRVSDQSEMGILQRQLMKKSAHTPIRRLFQQIPNLLPRVKPCLMMSPMSVAQYLDPAHPPFDLVVFDEASQIPIWDAVGAIARGREAVIVGDPKQLPPTNFFGRVDSEEEAAEEGLAEDLESILDDCIGAQIPWKHLNWHYRSRHESLIAFSNHNYYENRLLTFPSPSNDAIGVQWLPVPEGAYDKGRSRTNKVEAEAVVAEILARLADPVRSRRSIGVVTFSQAQQTLIENLLDAARADNPEIERFFATEHPEPLFVKNLENVQGDERDVILFSICYGPDAQGKVSMNFGPLNRDGGERRLNVAITRARREVLVFSTLRADHIDLARTRARGAADLKTFLDYAERGPSAIAEAVNLRRLGEFDSPFEKQVCEALEARGHAVHSQVGCSGYRIDLAIVDPAAPGRYLLGIECDGANYHRAKTARDRDRLREAVLNGLGWRIHRVWSTDWWLDPDGQLQRIEQAIDDARNAPPPEEPAPIAAPAETESSDETEKAPDREPTYAAAPSPTAAPAQMLAAPPQPELTVYAPLPAGPTLGESAAFQSREAEPEVSRLLAEVVAHEGPISLALAARRVAARWQVGRVTAAALRHVEQLVRAMPLRLAAHDDDLFLWPETLDPAAWSDFRVPGGEPESRRDARDLPPEEVANAALHVLAQQISLPTADLVRETARLLGFQRTGVQVDHAIRRGIDLLTRRGEVREDDGRVVLV